MVYLPKLCQKEGSKKKKNHWKRTALAAVLAMALLLAGCFAAAEGAEPYGDGDGVISREQLAGLYNWLKNADTDFYKVITFDQISDALGKKGLVREKDGDEYHAACWTDGDKIVTVTFRNRDGSWGVGSVTTDMPSDEYSDSDYSFLPRVGNRLAGSSATESQTVKAKLHGTSDEIFVTAQVPVEYWTAVGSSGEARFLNAADVTKASGNSAGIRVSFWPDEASLQAEREKSENILELEGWAALGTTLKGYSFTRYGMDMSEYVLPLKDDLWMSIQFYKCLPDAGSEAEAIVYSLAVEYGDFTYSCDVQPEPPAVNAPAGEPAAAPAAPAAEADGGLAGMWIAVEMTIDGKTINAADYETEMSIELREDGTAAPEAPVPQGSGEIMTEVKYTAKVVNMAGSDMDASILGGESSIILHDGGSVDFVVANTQVPGLLWKSDGDDIVIDYYGAGEIRIIAEGNGIALDFIGSYILKMVP